jgi:hypothetical protein
MMPMAIVAAAAVIPATIVSASIISATVVITVVVSGPPIWTVPVSVSVVRSRPVICRPVKNRNGNRQTEGKMNTGAGGRFSDERQSRDNHQQNDKLLHSSILDGNRPEFDQTDCVWNTRTGFQVTAKEETRRLERR